jgi:phage baseplate assembly protein W
MTRQEMPTCSVGVSIAQQLYLLIHTRYGELRSDRSFGCRVWEVEFERALNTGDWSDELGLSLQEAIRQHEPRLKSVQVSISSTVVDRNSFVRQPDEYRQRATVNVTALLTQTEEPFQFSTQLHVGQLAR